MRKYLAAALAATLALSAPAVALAAQGAKAAKPAAHKMAAEKTARGTVKSIDNDSVVLKGKKGDMKFKLDAAAKHDGIAAGSNVTVHYKTEGKDMIATSVMAAPMAAAKTSKPGKK